MKMPFNTRPARFDPETVQATIQRALASAGLDTTQGPLQTMQATLREAFRERGARTQPAAEGARAPEHPGRFETHDFSNPAGTRRYKVYTPPGQPAEAGPRPMLVMLHGCTQSADDFATGTRMNRLADEQGFIVVYPEQAQQANASRCWNWFQPQDQVRGAGEPALIAGLVLEAAQRHGADPQRIYVAGLSAGAAMAVVLGQTYPELFAGVGAHSGLPYGSAHDIPSALAAMKGGRSGLAGLRSATAREPGRAAPVGTAVPLIVFHGDRDHTVQASNAAQLVREAEVAYRARAGGTPLQVQTETGAAAGGRRYSRSAHVDALGQTWIEHWTLHGAGHAWSGGDARGSYTDSTGPDASAEMLRFFMALPRAGRA